MFLQKLKLTNFKNYATPSLNFTARVTAFVGSNGMGKTNLLDAIHYLCMTKSYFPVSDNDIIMKGSDFMRLEGDFLDKDNTTQTIAAKVQPRKKKIFECNGVVYETLAKHIGVLPVVMLAPDDTELIKEGSEARRRFLDNTLSQLDRDYLRFLLTYNKLLEQRNATLKKLSDNKHYFADDIGSLLGVYEQQMLPCANYIHQKRTQFLADFSPIFKRFYNYIAGVDEKISIVYDSYLFKQDLKNIWLDTRSKDIILHRTTQGIHRDDLHFTLDDKPLKRFGSQGQLKSFITALKLAQYEMLKLNKQTIPILLLDDIFDKFDAQRLKNLLTLLESDNYGQIFLTDTHIERINDLQNLLKQPMQIFQIQNGNILN